MFYAVITIILILLSYFIYIGNKNTHAVTINDIQLDNGVESVGDQSLRILHISDMHIENISVTPDQLFEQLKNQPIDLIALTGDFLDRKRSIPRLVPYLEALRKLNPVHGMYAVFGNHDYVLRHPYFEQLKDVLNNHGVKTLQNENETLLIDGKTVNIIGVDDFGTGHSDLEKSYDEVGTGYNLVLTHDPNVVLEMADYHYDYLLSGHFHGGQIYWPKPYHLVKMGKLVRMNMVKGLQKYKGRSFYISEGLGQTGVNIRIGSRPEITFHTVQLQPAEIKQNAGEAERTPVFAG
ncbi:metallophosphoesterase [Oceanobacillus saliphilus]|uniref:metallophosphoesterase n=1 Tax=Oceanobacillus saliphilus TaxID=2925834 RepID=UPI00201E5EB0|nr:metallophosphoesterase [Oceanobacillus saliphilus]